MNYHDQLTKSQQVLSNLWKTDISSTAAVRKKYTMLSRKCYVKVNRLSQEEIQKWLRKGCSQSKNITKNFDSKLSGKGDQYLEKAKTSTLIRESEISRKNKKKKHKSKKKRKKEKRKERLVKSDSTKYLDKHGRTNETNVTLEIKRKNHSKHSQFSNDDKKRTHLDAFRSDDCEKNKSSNIISQDCGNPLKKIKILNDNATENIHIIIPKNKILNMAYVNNNKKSNTELVDQFHNTKDLQNVFIMNEEIKQERESTSDVERVIIKDPRQKCTTPFERLDESTDKSNSAVVDGVARSIFIPFESDELYSNRADLCRKIKDDINNEKVTAAKTLLSHDNHISKLSKMSEILHLAIGDVLKKETTIENANMIQSFELRNCELKRIDKDFKHLVKLRSFEFCPMFKAILSSGTIGWELVLVLFCNLVVWVIRVNFNNINHLNKLQNIVLSFFEERRFREDVVLEVFSMDKNAFNAAVNVTCQLLEMYYPLPSNNISESTMDQIQDTVDTNCSIVSKPAPSNEQQLAQDRSNTQTINLVPLLSSTIESKNPIEEDIDKRPIVNPGWETPFIITKEKNVNNTNIASASNEVVRDTTFMPNSTEEVSNSNIASSKVERDRTVVPNRTNGEKMNINTNITTSKCREIRSTPQVFMPIDDPKFRGNHSVNMPILLKVKSFANLHPVNNVVGKKIQILDNFNVSPDKCNNKKLSILKNKNSKSNVHVKMDQRNNASSGTSQSKVQNNTINKTKYKKLTVSGEMAIPKVTPQDRILHLQNKMDQSSSVTSTQTKKLTSVSTSILDPALSSKNVIEFLNPNSTKPVNTGTKMAQSLSNNLETLVDTLKQIISEKKTHGSNNNSLNANSNRSVLSPTLSSSNKMVNTDETPMSSANEALDVSHTGTTANNSESQVSSEASTPFSRPSKPLLSVKPVEKINQQLAMNAQIISLHNSETCKQEKININYILGESRNISGSGKSKSSTLTNVINDGLQSESSLVGFSSRNLNSENVTTRSRTDLNLTTTVRQGIPILECDSHQITEQKNSQNVVMFNKSNEHIELELAVPQHLEKNQSLSLMETENYMNCNQIPNTSSSEITDNTEISGLVPEVLSCDKRKENEIVEKVNSVRNTKLVSATVQNHNMVTERRNCKSITQENGSKLVLNIALTKDNDGTTNNTVPKNTFNTPNIVQSGRQKLTAVDPIKVIKDLNASNDSECDKAVSSNEDNICPLSQTDSNSKNSTLAHSHPTHKNDKDHQCYTVVWNKTTDSAGYVTTHASLKRIETVLSSDKLNTDFAIPSKSSTVKTSTSSIIKKTAFEGISTARMITKHNLPAIIQQPKRQQTLKLSNLFQFNKTKPSILRQYKRTKQGVTGGQQAPNKTFTLNDEKSVSGKQTISNEIQSVYDEILSESVSDMMPRVSNAIQTVSNEIERISDEIQSVSTEISKNIIDNEVSEESRKDMSPIITSVVSLNKDYISSLSNHNGMEDKTSSTVSESEIRTTVGRLMSDSLMVLDESTEDAQGTGSQSVNEASNDFNDLTARPTGEMAGPPALALPDEDNPSVTSLANSEVIVLNDDSDEIKTCDSKNNMAQALSGGESVEANETICSNESTINASEANSQGASSASTDTVSVGRELALRNEDSDDDDVILVDEFPCQMPVCTKRITSSMIENSDVFVPEHDGMQVPPFKPMTAGRNVKVLMKMLEQQKRKCGLKGCTKVLKTGTAVLICSGCEQYCYCSTRCQLLDWYGPHRKICAMKHKDVEATNS